ncbi:MAG: hypothetical protein ACKVRO_11125 [Micropepsaceae bacterium]
MKALVAPVRRLWVSATTTLMSSLTFVVFLAIAIVAFAALSTVVVWLVETTTGTSFDVRNYVPGELQTIASDLSPQSIVAFFGAAVTIIVSYLTYSVTKNQSETQVFDFIERNLRPGSEMCLQIISGFEQLFVATNQISDFVGETILPQLAQKLEKKIPVPKAIEEICEEHDKVLTACIDQIQQRVSQISYDFQTVGHSLFFHAFLKAQLQRSLRRKDLFGFIRSNLSPSALRFLFGDHQAALKYEMRNIAERLNAMALNTTPVELIIAHLATPANATTLDYLGAVLLTRSFEPDQRKGNPNIDRVILNMGRSYLVVILQHLPEKTGLKLALQNLMPDQAATIDRLLEDLPIDRSDYSSPGWLENLDEEIAHMERSIYLVVEEGGKRTSRFSTRQMLRHVKGLSPKPTNE